MRSIAQQITQADAASIGPRRLVKSFAGGSLGSKRRFLVFLILLIPGYSVLAHDAKGTRFYPMAQVGVPIPISAGLSMRTILIHDDGRNGGTYSSGLMAAQAGYGGAKMSIGYGELYPYHSYDLPNFFGYSIKIAGIRTWGGSTVRSGQTFIGPEVQAIIFLHRSNYPFTLTLGTYFKVAENPNHRNDKVLIGTSLGWGF